LPKCSAVPESTRNDPVPTPPAYLAPGEVAHVSQDPDYPVPPPVAVAAPVEIELARHHIFSWKINVNRTEMIRRLSGSRATEQPTAQTPCRAKPNLIAGPVGDQRMFDPGEEIENLGSDIEQATWKLLHL
jgi:hypothetical protein